MKETVPVILALAILGASNCQSTEPSSGAEPETTEPKTTGSGSEAGAASPGPVIDLKWFR